MSDRPPLYRLLIINCIGQIVYPCLSVARDYN